MTKERILEILEGAKDKTGSVPMSLVRRAFENISNEPHWIPCSERLPEENIWIICQNNAGAMMIGKCDIEFGWMFPAYFDGIVAWMPLPEPYQPEEESE